MKLLILLLAITSFCLTMRFNAVDCKDEPIEVIHKLKLINDTTYQCSTFAVKHKDTTFFEFQETKSFPNPQDKLCH